MSSHSGVRRTARTLSIIGLFSIAAACATTGATFGSGVGDRQLERPPYYAGNGVPSSALPIVRMPVAYQRGAGQAPMFEPEGGSGSAIARLLDEMNAYLDSLGGTVRLDVAAPSGTPPDVQFGCNTDASGDCTTDEASAGVMTRSGPSMRLAVGRPSSSWVESLAPALDAAGAQSALVLTLEVGQYWTRQKSWRGDKAVDLGTGYSQDVPWLTSLDAPVQVLQLTGALVGRDGRAIRIGAEGLFARRTGLVASGFGLQSLLSDEDVERVRTLVREDLPERPLAWKAAMRNLVSGLTGTAAVGEF